MSADDIVHLQLELLRSRTEVTDLQSKLRSCKRIANASLAAHRTSDNPASTEGRIVPGLWLAVSDESSFRELIEESDNDVRKLGAEDSWYLQPIPPAAQTPIGFQQSFPVEILLQVVSYLPNEALGRLCSTSIAFAEAFLPILYREVQVKPHPADFRRNTLFVYRPNKHSRINDMLSSCLSHISFLTVHASLLGGVHFDRVPSSPIQMNTLSLIMDVDHLEESEYDDWPNPYSSYLGHEPRRRETLDKAFFWTNPPFLRMLDPRTLIIEAEPERSRPESDRPWTSFVVNHLAARTISSWPRLKLVQLKNALLYTTRDGSVQDRHHLLIPSHLSTFTTRNDPSSVLVQLHVSPARYSDLVFKDVYRQGSERAGLEYLSKIHRGRTINICYPDEAARDLLERSKKEHLARWPDPSLLRFCSMEEGQLMAEDVLKDDAGVDGLETGA